MTIKNIYTSIDEKTEKYQWNDRQNKRRDIHNEIKINN